MTQVINQEVDVNAFYFGKNMRTFPRQMQYGGREVTFADGLRLSIQRGAQLTYFYDMNSADGATYRLRQEGAQWMLIGTL